MTLNVLSLEFPEGFATFICIAPGRRRCAQLEVSPPLLVACARSWRVQPIILLVALGPLPWAGVTLFLGLLWQLEGVY